MRDWKVGDLMKFNGAFSGTDYGVVTRITNNKCSIYWFVERVYTTESLRVDPTRDDDCLYKIG